MFEQKNGTGRPDGQTSDHCFTFFAMETASVKMFLNVVVWPASDKEKKKFITD